MSHSPLADEEITEVPDRPPLLVAQGLGLRTAHGWSYRGVDLALDEHMVHVVVGRRGSGRSSLLLSLTGRMAPSVGSVTLDGSPDPKRMRSLTAVARVGEFIDLEPRLTVAEALAERCLMDGVPYQDGRRRFGEAAAMLGMTLEPRTLVEDLPGRGVTRLAVALACVRPSHLIVLDDLERDLDSVEQEDLLRHLTALAVDGPSILVATVDQLPVDRVGVASTALLRIEDPVKPPPATPDPTVEPERTVEPEPTAEPEPIVAAGSPAHGRHEAPSDDTDAVRTDEEGAR